MTTTAPGDRGDVVVAAARASDEAAFAEVVGRHRRELRVHCYRMLGSVEEAEDLVQETFLRAWRHIAGFEGRSTLRAWLYRIATNACLDALDGRARRVLPQDLEPATTDPGGGSDPMVARTDIGWPARQTADHLGLSEAAASSALHRARATLRERLPERRADWATATATTATATATPTADEQAVVRRYMAALERADLEAVADLLAEEVRAAMPPWTLWLAGRPAVLAALTESWDPRSPDHVGRFRTLAVRANGQPGGAIYRRAPGDPARADYPPFALGVLAIEDGRITDMVAFHDPALFPLFGLPEALPEALPGDG